MNDEPLDDLPYDATGLANYVANRISMNNYAEAARAARVLADRLAPVLVASEPVAAFAWTSEAELARLKYGHAATMWGEKFRYADVDVPLFRRTK